MNCPIRKIISEGRIMILALEKDIVLISEYKNITSIEAKFGRMEFKILFMVKFSV